MKQLKHFLLMAAMLMCSFAASAHDFVKNGIYYELPDQIDFANLTVSVTYMGGDYSDYTNEYRGHVVIPSTVTYRGTTYRVVHIGADAFACCDALTSVVIPSTVTSIGEYAFWNCSSLISINIPKDVTSIGESAFSGCGSLSSIVVAGGNRVYDSRDNCNAIIETRSNTLIRGCGKTIIPASVTSIGSRAFENCSSLTAINLPESVTSIGRGAFRSCSSLTSVVLPKNLRRIKELTFYECSSLASITIPDGVTHIEQEAFHDCSSLTSIIIPASVTRIGAYAFDGCRSLTSVKCPRQFKYLFPKAGFDKVGDFVFYENTLIGYVGNSSDVVLPKSFDGKNYVVGERAFENSLVKVTSISIPEGVTNIADGAFSGCGDLKRVTINCAHVGDWFRQNSSIKEITLGESVKSIADGAFNSCSGLIAIRINDIASWCNIDFGNQYSNPLLYASNLYLNGKLVTKLTIPNTVTAIKDYAFLGCNLTSITLPESVTSIGLGAFAYCRNLTFITLPEGVTSIGTSAFYDCDRLTSITLPMSVTSIGSSAFESCSSLTSINIPEGVMSIGTSAFSGCRNLTSITLPEGVARIENLAFYGCNGLKQATINCVHVEDWFRGNTSIKEIVLGEGVTSIGAGAFSGCSSLTSISLPKSLKSIGSNAFCECSSLTSVTIPESVTSIGDNAFRSCSSLASVTVSQGVTSIGRNAFIWCRSLTSITIPKERAKLLNGTFGDENVKLKVNGKTRTIKPQKNITKFYKR